MYFIYMYISDNFIDNFIFDKLIVAYLLRYQNLDFSQEDGLIYRFYIIIDKIEKIRRLIHLDKNFEFCLTINLVFAKLIEHAGVAQW